MTKAKPRRDLQQEITDKIIGQLESGVFPWVQPWEGTAQAFTLPENVKTGNTYSGVNILLCWIDTIEKGFQRQQWVTFKHALDLGGNVRKGEKGTKIVYASQFTPKDEQARAQADPDYEARSRGFLKSYTVFNIDQCDGLDDYRKATTDELPARQIEPAAEALIKATGADFRIGGDKAFYVPGSDFIQVPHQAQFTDQINYYRTCFHELGHWTGHPSRLDRNLQNKFGSKDYAREELVAEMASAFTCAAMGIRPTVRHADYLGAWLNVLQEDNRAIIKAASMASKASNFILDHRGETIALAA